MRKKSSVCDIMVLSSIMGIFDIFKKRKQNKEIGDTSTQSLTINDADKGLEVVLESLPTTFNETQGHLVEITEPSVLARIDAVIPAASVAGTSVAKAVGSTGETLYKVVLKNGGQLVDSRTVAGAKRAITMGKNGIAEHANLLEVNPSELGKMANVGATVFSVASIIVGQYYMQQIDSKIGAISDELKGIASTLDIQYRSQTASLIESVYNISKFQVDILANEELRLRELDNIQELRKDCQTLLNQAEAKIEMILASTNSNYDKYSSAIKELEKWDRYQTILLQVFAQINELDFALSMGNKTKEHCYGSFAIHTKKLNEIHAHMLSWHKEHCELLQIDVDSERRKHTGVIAKLFEKPIGAINEEWNYKSIDKDIVCLIRSQTSEQPQHTFSTENLYEKDVEIVVKGDKKYYLVK